MTDVRAPRARRNILGELACEKLTKGTHRCTIRPLIDPP